MVKKNGTSYINDSSVTIVTLLNVRQTCVVIYVALMLSLIAIWLFKNAIIVSVCTKASIHLHMNMFNAIIRSPLYFFKTNKSGNDMKFKLIAFKLYLNIPNFIFRTYFQSFFKRHGSYR